MKRTVTGCNLSVVGSNLTGLTVNNVGVTVLVLQCQDLLQRVCLMDK